MNITSLIASGAVAVFLGTTADIDALESKYGVSIDRNWTGYKISTYVHGSYRNIASAKLSISPKELDKELEILRDNKLISIEKTYSIEIGKSGSEVDETAYGQMHQTAHEVPLRTPKLGELYTLEYALEHSIPSQHMGSALQSRGVSIYFLDQNKPLTASEWGYDKKGKPALFIERGVSFGRSLEENLMHQLSHNSAFRMGWNPYESWSWPMAKQLGFIYAGDPNITDITFNGYKTTLPRKPSAAWLLKSSEGPDFFYKQIDFEQWMRCDKNLQLLDDNGNPVSMNQARKLSAERIRNFALIRPVTSEFSTPPEVFADALAMFRSDKECRAELLEISPLLYKLVRDHDQMELDKTYGKGLRVRAIDGTVTQPSEAVLKEIRNLEESKAS
ncbi:MAG: hypothetical protein K2X27_09020 [Candidatus Obscuribacterales bacterium]|nr:hypothetical protein [Candidatus Obscuribacterales bacterium]